MRVEVNLNDDWVDEVVTASLRGFIRRHQGEDGVPITEMKRVLEFYSVKEDFEDFLEDIQEIENLYEHQIRFDF